MFSEFRFLIFANDNYYPSGGFKDFVFGFNTFDEFKQKIENETDFRDEWYVLDLTNFKNTEICEFDYIKDKEKARLELIEKIKLILEL